LAGKRFKKRVEGGDINCQSKQGGTIRTVNMGGGFLSATGKKGS